MPDPNRFPIDPIESIEATPAEAAAYRATNARNQRFNPATVNRLLLEVANDPNPQPTPARSGFDPNPQPIAPDPSVLIPWPVFVLLLVALAVGLAVIGEWIATFLAGWISPRV